MKKQINTIPFDPACISTFKDVITLLEQKSTPAVRKRIFNRYFAKQAHKKFRYKTTTGKHAYIYVMEGAVYTETEFHIAGKLIRAGYHVVFPNKGDLGKGRKNDVYLYDAKTYIQQKVELKSLFGHTADAVKSQIISGSGQAGIIAYDIQSKIKPNWLIQGLRNGWSSNLKTVMINWKGQWYQIEQDLLFGDEIYRFFK